MALKNPGDKIPSFKTSEYLPLLLNQAAGLVETAQWGHLEAYDINPVIWILMVLLREFPTLSHRNFCELTSISATTIARASQEALRKGLIKKELMANHQRNLQFKLSKNGHALVTQIMSFEERLQTRMTGSLSKSDVKRLIRYLNAIRSNLRSAPRLVPREAVQPKQKQC